MTNVFRSVLRMSAVQKALWENPGVECRVRVDDLTGVHEILTLESGHPIRRPRGVYAAQTTQFFLADESGDDQAMASVRAPDVQKAVKSLVSKHHENRIRSVSELYIIDWYMNRATVVEVTYARASADPPPVRA